MDGGGGPWRGSRSSNQHAARDRPRSLTMRTGRRASDRWSLPLASAALAVLAAPAAAGEAPLHRVQVIPLRGPAGRLDHLALDRRHHRLFVANMANASLDVVDLEAGELV